MSNGKAKPSALIIIAAAVVIIFIVFFYASGQLKAQQKPERIPITTQTPLSGGGSEQKENNSGEGLSTGGTENTGNIGSAGGNNTTVQAPENNGPSINEAFEDTLWQEK